MSGHLVQAGPQYSIYLTGSVYAQQVCNGVQSAITAVPTNAGQTGSPVPRWFKLGYLVYLRGDEVIGTVRIEFDHQTNYSEHSQTFDRIAWNLAPGVTVLITELWHTVHP